jgi:hypothetical protein
VQVYAGGAWTTYFLYAGTPAKWVLLGDGSKTDQGSTVLPPGQGVFVSKLGSSQDVLMFGEVRQNDFIRPLQGSGSGGTISNLVGGGFPIDQKATGEGSRAMRIEDRAVTNGFYGDRDFKKADSFSIWQGDATPGASGYDTCFRFSNASPAALWWAQVGDKDLRDDTLTYTRFLSDRSVFIRSKIGLPKYTIPCPWAP